MPMDQIIAKRGDVLLELFKDSKPAGTLLVSSHVLSLASPVFEAMFNGNFAEGQELSPESPKKIALPEDDPGALTLLARITHMKCERDAEETTLECLADFALVCDKYQCTTAVQSWSRLQVLQKLRDEPLLGYERLIFITYVLDLFREFEQVSLRIVRDKLSADSYCAATHGVDFVPIMLLDRLRYKKGALGRASHQQLFPQQYHSLVKSKCTQSGARLKAYLASLARAKIPVDDVLAVPEYAKRAADLKMLVNDVHCTEHSDCAVRQAESLNQDVARALISTSTRVKPCCLDCMRMEIGIQNVVCRLGHDTSQLLL